MKSAYASFVLVPLVAAILVSALGIGTGHDFPTIPSIRPATLEATLEADNRQQRVTMSEMLQIAEDALQATIQNIDTYTARMIKQEQDREGVLQPQSEAFIKIVTRHPGGKPGGPMRVYMRFDSPDSVKGREVIWVEDEHDGKLLVREAGLIGRMMTVPLAPDSQLAMRGQRYPITELGLTRLLEKLIERGGTDRDDPSVKVIKTEGYVFEDRELTHLRIEREKPSGAEDDFSLAELVLDREKQVVVSYRSFGWAANETDSPPLIESYEYQDLKLNVNFGDKDFMTSNTEYTFAK